MFENSLLTRPELSCQHHPKERVSVICTELQCQANPLLCNACFKDFDIKNKHTYHEASLRNSWEGFNEVAALIDKDRIIMDKLYRQVVAKKQNEQLIRWQEDKERHYVSIEKHINSLKYQLEEEIKNIYRLFETAIVQAKDLVCQSLDTYYQTYRQNFEIFSKMIDPLVVYGRSQKYFANVNNITLKLLTEPRKKGSEWLASVKSNLSSIQKITSNMVPFQDNLDRATTYMNAMIDSLPTVEFEEEKILKSIKYVAYEAMKGSLKICDLKSLNLILGNSNTADLQGVSRRNVIFGKGPISQKITR